MGFLNPESRPWDGVNESTSIPARPKGKAFAADTEGVKPMGEEIEDTPKSSRDMFYGPHNVEKDIKKFDDVDMDKVNKVLVSSNEGNDISFPHGAIKRAGTRVKAGVTIAGLDMFYGGDKQIKEVFKIAGLTKDEIAIANKYKNFKSSSYSDSVDDIKEVKRIRTEAKRELEPIRLRVRSALVKYNLNKAISSRIGLEGNYESTNDIPWLKNLNDESKAAIAGMRIKNKTIDFIASDTSIKSGDDFIDAIESKLSSVKDGKKVFNAVDEKVYRKYLDVLKRNMFRSKYNTPREVF